MTSLETLADPQNADVDIVIVPGLDPSGSSQHGLAKQWMRDFLPVTIPTARIILFSYNQRRAFSQGIYSLDDVASILLLGLKLEREKIVEPERSIIFLAHSLGGFIVKHTLLRAGTEPRYQFLRSGTHGIGFFATPHQGAGSQPLSSVVASISRLQRWEYKGASESISWSDGRQHQYQSRLADLEILSFYETRPTKQLGLIVHKQSATFGSGREQLIPLDTDHYHIFEFSFASDENYKRFASCLVNMVRNAPTVKNKRERVESSLEAEALTLRGIDSSYIYENLNGLSHQRKHLASTSFGSMRQNIDIPSPSITGLGITMAQRGLAATDDDQPSVHSSTQKDAPQAPQESETNANLRNQSDIGSSEAILPPLSTEPLANDDIKSAPGSPSVTPMGSDYSSFTDDGELQEEDFHADDIPDSILGIIPELARGSMTDYVRIRLLNWLQVLPMRGHGGGSKGGQAHHEPASFGSGLISTSRSSGQDSEKRAGKRRANDDENNDESGNRKRTQTTEPAGDEGSDRPFACPFVKHDPLEHWMCWRVSFRRIHDLKQHLRRRHYDPISCARCGEVFDTAKERDQHHRAEQPCKSIDLTGRWGGVGEDQKSWLQKNKPQTKSDEEYWFMIFGKLFYIHPPLSMPDDPYPEDPEVLILTSARRLLCRDRLRVDSSDHVLGAAIDEALANHTGAGSFRSVMVPDRHNDPLQGQQMMSLGHHSDSIGAQLQRQGHPSGSRESLIRIEPRTVLEQAPDNGATHFLRQDVSSSELHNPPNVGRTGFRFGTNTPTIGGEFPTLPRGFPGQMQMVDDNWVQLGGSMGLGTDHDNFEGYGQSSVSDTLPPLNPPIDWTHFWEGEGQTAPGPSSGEYRG